MFPVFGNVINNIFGLKYFGGKFHYDQITNKNTPAPPHPTRTSKYQLCFLRKLEVFCNAGDS